MPPFSQVTYRIDVPPEAARWKHTSTHTTNLQIFMEQGTVPYKTSGDNFRSTTANSSLNQYLLNTFLAWPWVPNQSYFVTVTNVSAGTEPLTFTMDGRNTVTDDNDNDLLPDAWELAYFGNLKHRDRRLRWGWRREYRRIPRRHEPDRQHILPSAPRNVGGQRIVFARCHATELPDGLHRYADTRAERRVHVRELDGQRQRHCVPYPLLMNGHKVVSALFKVIGDDFSTRVPLSGRNIIANGSNIGATKEPGEPNHAGNPGGNRSGGPGILFPHDQ